MNPTEASPKSLYTYKITKRFSIKREAVVAGMLMTGHSGQTDDAVRVEKTGSKEWTITLMLKDTDLNGEHASLFEHWLNYKGSYGMETYVTA